jgi:hypothetical protein
MAFQTNEIEKPEFMIQLEKERAFALDSRVSSPK